MYVKTMKTTDFNGVEKEVVIRFNITETELTDMALSKGGGLEEYLKRIIGTKNLPELNELFKTIIDLSYGVKSDDGVYFRKSPELLADFKATQAYSDFCMELLTNVDEANRFIDNIIPTKMKADIYSIKANTPALK